MKITTILIVGIAAMMVGCGGSERMIPEAKMEAIIREAYLADGYVNNINPGVHSGHPSDSIDIYTPILKRYGYTSADLKYSIAKYGARKSQKINTIYANVHNSLKKEFDELNYYYNKLRIRDSIVEADMIAVVFKADTLIKIKTRKQLDTTVFAVPIIGNGTYTVSYRYSITENIPKKKAKPKDPEKDEAEMRRFVAKALAGDVKDIPVGAKYRYNYYITSPFDSVIRHRDVFQNLLVNNPKRLVSYNVNIENLVGGTLFVRPVVARNITNCDIQIRNLEVKYKPEKELGRQLQDEKITNIKLKTHAKDSSILHIFRRDTICPPRLRDAKR